MRFFRARIRGDFRGGKCRWIFFALALGAAQCRQTVEVAVYREDGTGSASDEGTDTRPEPATDSSSDIETDTDSSPAFELAFSSGNYFSVWGSSSGDIWAVGQNGARPALVHYDGEKWSEIVQYVVLDAALEAVWGASPSSVYFVGNASIGGVGVWHDGASDFELLPLSPLPTEKLADIHGTSDGDVYVIGEYGTVIHCADRACAKLDLQLKTDRVPLWSGLFAATASSVWLAGVALRLASENEGVIARFDGKSWSYVNSKTPLGGIKLNAVWASGDDDVYIVGSKGALLHYDGVSWERASHPLLTSEVDLRGVYGLAGKDVIAVGQRTAAGVEPEGIGLRLRGGVWTSLHVPDKSPLYDVWMDKKTGLAFAVGNAGVLRLNP